MVKKYSAAVERILTWIEGNLSILNGPLTIGGIALACGLSYVDERQPIVIGQTKNRLGTKT